MSTLAFVLTLPAVEDDGTNVMAYGPKCQRYATSQILRHQYCFELHILTPAPANLLGIVLCHYKHPLIISWVLSLAYFDGAEKMPSPDAYPQIGMHVITGLNVGLSPKEIVGCIMHLVPYVGFPRALNALRVAQQVFAEQGVQVD